ncbi:MAG: PAS domain S-box protein [Desulfobacterales bacterium]|nr:PAS domain S-box protein [Desulfobacterales bacterium]
MLSKPTYEELADQIEVLGEESRKRLVAEQALRRQNAYLSALHETSLGLVNRLDRNELLEAILDRATTMTDTEHGFIYLHEPDEDRMRMELGIGFFTGQIGLRVKPGEGLGGKVWQAGEPLVVERYYSWDGRLPDPDLETLHTVVGIPLKSGEVVHGVIGMAGVDPRKQFEQGDIDILSRFAELAMIALDNASLYEGLRRELAEHRRTEVNLRESEKRYRSLLESSPDPIIVYDMDGQAVYVNPAFEQTLGWQREELIGGNINFVPEENWPETREAIKSMLSGKKIQLFETRRLTRDGQVLDVQISSTLYDDHSGKPAGNIVILRDITARKRAERELLRYHEQLERLVEARTAALERSNRRLAREVEERRRAEEAQRRSKAELAAQSDHLEEVNTALKVLLKQRESDKGELEDNLRSNVRELVAPYLERLKKARLNAEQTSLVHILESNLDNIVSPFISRLCARHFSLTPMEIKVANLIKAGRSSQEIADLLYLAKNTVLFHRYNIRRKLGLLNTKSNLATHLLSFDK